MTRLSSAASVEPTTPAPTMSTSCVAAPRIEDTLRRNNRWRAGDVASNNNFECRSTVRLFDTLIARCLPCVIVLLFCVAI